MIDAVRKRFDPKEKNVKVEDKVVQDEAVASSVQANSHGDELKMRPRRGTLLDGEEVDDPPPI